MKGRVLLCAALCCALCVLRGCCAAGRPPQPTLPVSPPHAHTRAHRTHTHTHTRLTHATTYTHTQRSIHDRSGSGAIDFEAFADLEAFLKNVQASHEYFDSKGAGALDADDINAALTHAGALLCACVWWGGEGWGASGEGARS